MKALLSALVLGLALNANGFAASDENQTVIHLRSGDRVVGIQVIVPNTPLRPGEFEVDLDQLISVQKIIDILPAEDADFKSYLLVAQRQARIVYAETLRSIIGCLNEATNDGTRVWTCTGDVARELIEKLSAAIRHDETMAPTLNVVSALGCRVMSERDIRHPGHDLGIFIRTPMRGILQKVGIENVICGARDGICKVTLIGR